MVSNMVDARQERFMTVKEVSQFLRIKVQTVYDLLATGDLPGTKFGNAWRIDRDQLEQKLRGQK
jgi:excisionase family DNA binding protein